MRPEELRIGNWVFEDYSGEMIVSSVHRMDCNDTYDYYLQKAEGLPIGCYSDIKPILITEEWLERLGFENKNGYWVEDDHLVMLAYFDDEDLYLTTSNDDKISSSLLFVHQLQNLYYSLTGEELKLK